MIIQIYTVQSADEAKSVIASGVDQLGITPSNYGLPGEVSYDRAADIFSEIEGMVTRVALSVDTDIDEITRMVNVVRPDILHLCGPSETRLPPAAFYLLRRLLPGIRLMQAVSVGRRDSVRTAMSYQDAADFLILDTEVSHIGGVGASGKVHDWEISKEIVRRSHIPVILAGGLSAENVAEAIEAVRPWGVDSLTHTNRNLEAGGFVKDLDKIERFVENAQLAG